MGFLRVVRYHWGWWDLRLGPFLQVSTHTIRTSGRTDGRTEHVYLMGRPFTCCGYDWQIDWLSTYDWLSDQLWIIILTRTGDDRSSATGTQCAWLRLAPLDRWILIWFWLELGAPFVSNRKTVRLAPPSSTWPVYILRALLDVIICVARHILYCVNNYISYLDPFSLVPNN